MAAMALTVLLGIAALSSENGKYFEISKNIEIFTNLYKEINTYYADDVDPARLMRVGVDAMLNSLDPFTNYFSESELEQLRYQTDGKYNGIGAHFRLVDQDIVISEPYENSPALKAGLKAGDVLLAIDGKTIKGKSPDEVSDILKGFPGTEVDITVSRPGERKELVLKLKREEVVISNVPYSGMLPGDVGYIALTTFSRDAGANVAKALEALKAENPNMKGVIFDLRGNGGGLLVEGVNVTNVFIPKNELVVTTKGKVVEWDRSFKTLNPPVDEKLPLAILVDEGTASASEIVSGTIQDLDRGVVIGQRTYGKGLVQNTRDIGYNAKLKLTTAKYYIPSGRCIQGVTYKDGKPVDIPDEKRTKFKTKAGRTVLDGGGIKPDVWIDKSGSNALINALDNGHIIFNYVTQWALKHPEVKDLNAFHFTEWEDFIRYVESGNFNYKTETEKTLLDIRSKADKEHLTERLDSELKTLYNKLNEIKKGELTKYKEQITAMIEKEIVSRYFFQKGRIQMGLLRDVEVKKAIEVITKPSEYNKLLKK